MNNMENTRWNSQKYQRQQMYKIWRNWNGFNGTSQYQMGSIFYEVYQTQSVLSSKLFSLWNLVVLLMYVLVWKYGRCLKR